MRYRLLGKSGVRISEVALGTMTFGEDWGWGASPDVSARMLDLFADAGQYRHFLAAQPAHAAATGGVWDADVLRLNHLTPGAQILADQVLMLH